MRYQEIAGILYNLRSKSSHWKSLAQSRKVHRKELREKHSREGEPQEECQCEVGSWALGDYSGSVNRPGSS